MTTKTTAPRAARTVKAPAAPKAPARARTAAAKAEGEARAKAPAKRKAPATVAPAAPVAAPAPVKAPRKPRTAKAKPVAAPVAPVVKVKPAPAAMAARKVASAALAGVASDLNGKVITLPAKAPAPAGHKVASATTHPAAPVAVVPVAMRVTVVLIEAGAATEKARHQFDAVRGMSGDVLTYVQTQIAPQVQGVLGWSRISLEAAPTAFNKAQGQWGFNFGGPRRGLRAICTMQPAPADATPAAPAAPAAVVRSLARVDGMAARLGLPAPSATPVTDARRAATAARVAAAPARTEAAPRVTAKYREMMEACAKGKLPEKLDFSKETHARYRSALANAEAMAKRKDIDGLRAVSAGIQPISSSRRALKRWVDMTVMALEARAAKATPASA